MNERETDELLDRISITMRGLDLRPTRPNAVILLADGAAEMGEELAETIAETLLGNRQRVIDLDFGQYDRPEDINTLLGAPPAYIGFGEHLPLHDLAHMPWSVVVCKNIDGCHPQVRALLTQTLADGFLTERSGKRVYLSDSVIILTAPSEAARGFTLGFLGGEATRQDGSALESALGARLLEQVDVVRTSRMTHAGETKGWVERTLLPGLAVQYRGAGLTLEWDPTFVAWVHEQQQAHPSRLLLTKVVERRLGKTLIAHLPPPGHRLTVAVEVEDGEVRVAEPVRPTPTRTQRKDAKR